MKAVINTLPSCPWCVKVKSYDLKGLEYQEILSKSQKWKTVPYIEIDGPLVASPSCRYLQCI